MAQDIKGPSTADGWPQCCGEWEDVEDVEDVRGFAQGLLKVTSHLIDVYATA